jgi:hypothetical protein
MPGMDIIVVGIDLRFPRKRVMTIGAYTADLDQQFRVESPIADVLVFIFIYS